MNSSRLKSHSYGKFFIMCWDYRKKIEIKNQKIYSLDSRMITLEGNLIRKKLREKASRISKEFNS